MRLSFRTLLKPSLLLLVIVIDLVTWPDLYDEMGLRAFLRVPVIFCILMAALVAAAYTPTRWLRWTYAGILSICSLLILSYRFSVGEVSTYFAFVTTIDASSAFGDAIQMHYATMLAGLVAASATFLAIAMSPPAIPSFRRRRFMLPLLMMPPLVYLCFAAFLFDRHGQIRGIPSSWQGAGFATMYMIDATYGNSGPRRQPSIAHIPPEEIGDIVFIIDESVSGNYLDLNAVGGAYSGLTSARPGWSIYDFGIASSMVNCSVQSNVAMRFGGRRGDIQQKVARWPSIWSYAKNAGYRTVHMYGQRGGGNENYMTDEEAAGIDDRLRYEDVEWMDRDQHIAADLIERIGNDQREFILINKLGVHFPLVGKYPDEPRPFQPEGDPLSVIKDAGYWQGYRNNYRNALEWSVGAFFDRVFNEVTEDVPLTIVYTSDHGQTFYERSEPGSTTHCKHKPIMEEGAVPLVVIERGAQRQVDWLSALEARHDSSGQARIFPSLLLMMGYNPAEVARDYGSSLTDGDADEMMTASSLNLRLGPDALWFKVDPSEVYRPTDPPSRK